MTKRFLLALPQTTSSNWPVIIPWPTTSICNETHPLTRSVRDATGNTK